MTATRDDWMRELRDSLASVEELRAAGLLTGAEATRLGPLGERFAVKVTRYYAGLMRVDDPGCPIRRQALPWLGEEDPVLPEWARRLSVEVYGRETPWSGDPIGDLAKLAEPRLTHRYGNRAILHLASSCSVNCRFCFRKEALNDRDVSLYGGGAGAIEAALAHISRTPSIRELILTGGDPLNLGDRALSELLEKLEGIPHLRGVRIHSRMPVTLPSRLDEGLARVLGTRGRRLKLSLAAHFNHARELTHEAREGLDRLAAAKVALYNQSVLLAGVNDSVEVLEELFQALFEAGIRPFYLHHPDWAAGTFGYRVSIERGRALMRALQGRVPGPAMPGYVLDLPGGHGKVPLLDSERVRRLCGFEGEPDCRVAGARYEVVPPLLDGGSGASLDYLDLYPSGPC